MSFDFIARKFSQLAAVEREAEPVCMRCEGGGWECYGLGFGDPHFRVCEECYNPEGYLSP